MRFGSSPMATTASMSSSFNSYGIELSQAWAYSVQFNWWPAVSGGSTGVGTIKLQVSNDNVKPPMDGVGDPAGNVRFWADYTDTAMSTTATAGTSSFMINVNTPGYRWMRAIYQASSGSGAMSINYFGHGWA